MKELRALIKVESKTALFVGLYFLAINIVALALGKLVLDERYTYFLRWGINEANVNLYGEVLFPIIGTVTLFSFLGFVLLVYFQFKNEKSIEIGRFLKVLPFTTSQKGLVKVILGIISYTVPFFILVVGTLSIRQIEIHRYQEIYNVLKSSELIYEMNKIEYLLQFLILTYMVMTAVYLFLVMIQYLVNHNIGSIIISIFSVSAPIFIALSMENIYSRMIESNVYDKLFIPFYNIILDSQSIAVDSIESRYLSFSYVAAYSSKIIILLVAIILCIGVITLVSSKMKVEDGDIFIPYKVPRWIFIMGVTICSSFMIADLGSIFILPLLLEETFLATQILIIIGAVLGFLIAHKIAHLGLIRKGAQK